MQSAYPLYMHFTKGKQQEQLLLVDSFLRDLDKSEDTRYLVPIFQKLTQKKVTYNFYESETPTTNIKVYIIMVNGKGSYTALVSLGKEFGLPRGFPIVWVPSFTSIQLFGFYPKFSNDNNVTNANESNDQEIQSLIDQGKTIVSMQINKKFSGSLGQVLCFKVGENSSSTQKKEYYWTTCSKKSADTSSKYSQRIKQAVEHVLTPEKIQYLANHNIYLGGEVMHPDDTSHGYKSEALKFIITCVSHTSSFSTSSSSEKINIKYFTNEEMLEFCIKMGLECGEQFIITPVEKNNQVFKNVLNHLLMDRSFITDDVLEKRMDQLKSQEKEVYHCNFLSSEGTVKHKDVVTGNVLEGLIIKFTTDDGQTTIVKFKFPYYTLVTMFLRQECLEKEQFDQDPTNYLKRWCTPNSFSYFGSLCVIARDYMAKNRTKGLSGKQEIEENGLHIAAAEYARQKMTTIIAQKEDYPFQKLKKNHSATVILFLGHVGAGKSTYASYLKDHLLATWGIDAGIVDGDKILYHDEKNLTQSLGKLRSTCHHAKVYEQFLNSEKNVIIISGGGGVLLNKRGTKLEIKDCLENVFPEHSFQVVTCYCTPKHTSVVSFKKSEFETFESKGEDTEIEKIVKSRLESTEWTLTKTQNLHQLTQQIKKVCAKNKDIAKIIVEDSDYCFAVPSIQHTSFTSSSSGVKDTIDALSAEIMSLNIFSLDAITGTSISKNMVFSKQYAILKIDDEIFHTTLRYENDPVQLSSCSGSSSSVQQIKKGDTLQCKLYSLQVQEEEKKSKPIKLEVYHLLSTNKNDLKTHAEIPHATVSFSNFPNKDSYLIIKYAMEDRIHQLEFKQQQQQQQQSLVVFKPLANTLCMSETKEATILDVIYTGKYD